jgi:hypothetical protein
LHIFGNLSVKDRDWGLRIREMARMGRMGRMGKNNEPQSHTDTKDISQNYRRVGILPAFHLIFSICLKEEENFGSISKR